MPESTDPFDELRSPVVPVPPRARFADLLRRRIRTELAPLVPSQEVTTMAVPTLSPYLLVAGATRAIDWYRDVFGAIETMRFTGDDGRIGHAELTIGPARVMLADEDPAIGRLGPASLGGTSVLLHLEVTDVDDTHRRGVAAGATSEREPADQGHGNRNATFVDPFGHLWMLSQPIDGTRAGAAQAGAETGAAGPAWTVSGRQPVEPGYITLATTDLDRARAFYGALFGWDVHDGSQPGGGHVANTRFPVGFMTDGGATADVAGPLRSVYFRVDDLDAYAARAVELGGQVVERRDVASGGNLVCLDDQGVRFDLWKPAPGY